MTKLIPTLFIFFLTISFTFAQSVSDSSLQECSVIQEPATRLVCYDALVNPSQIPYYCSDTNEAYRAECQARPAQTTPAIAPAQQNVRQQKPEYCSNTTESWRTECGGDGVYQQPQVHSASAQPEYCLIATNKWLSECGGNGIAPNQQGQSSNQGVDSWTFSNTPFLETYVLSNISKHFHTGFDYDKVMLRISCNSRTKKLMATIHWDTYLGDTDTVEIIYQIGSNAPTIGESANNDTVTGVSDDSYLSLLFLQNLASSEGQPLKVVVNRSIDYSLYIPTIFAVFDTTGLSQNLQKVTQPCGY